MIFKHGPLQRTEYDFRFVDIAGDWLSRYWRILHNEKKYLYCSPNIVKTN